MFTLKSYIEQRVPAWKACSYCNGTGSLGSVHGMAEAHFPCEACDGKGRTWHGAVWFNPNTNEWLVNVVFPVRVTKTSFLMRRWGVCEKSEPEDFYGERCQTGRIFKRDRVYPDSWIYVGLCSHCHRDADGKPTGAEPGTAGEWEVVEDTMAEEDRPSRSHCRE